MDKIVQGNAQPLDALVATPNGWKRMGDIIVGDKVLTPYGNVTTITGVYPKGVRPVYRITLRDGSHVEACNQHLWEIERYKTIVKYKGVDENGHKIYVKPENGKTCELIHEIIDTDELKRRVDKGRQINLPKIKPVAYDEVELPIHPYVMGVILGDGNIDKRGRVTITVDKKDNEILDRIESFGYEFKRANGKSDSKTPVYYVKGVGKIMRELGLAGHRSWEKFIPVKYLYSSIEQRIELLRGIMDTDGTISKKGEMEFTSSSVELAEDVQSLIRSLGGRVGLNVKPNVSYTSPTQKIKKKARPAYRIQNIRLSSINPFSLTRKTDRWHDRTDNAGNRVVSVEYVRDDEVQCIRIADERHLYLTDNYIPTHNTSNIVFLKSTDDSMLDTLQKMSGVTHKTFIDSKTVTKDNERLFMQNKGEVTYTVSTKEVPVITYNDMAFISERNSIVFRAGDSPVWNRNETILPMSWRLFKNTIVHAGHEYSLQTIPTLSSALDFDVRKNQPDFNEMLSKRMAQANVSAEAQEKYKEAYNYSDYEMSRLDPDVYSDEIMVVINEKIRRRKAEENNISEDDYDGYIPDMVNDQFVPSDIEDNQEVIEATAKAQQEMAEWNRKLYAGKMLSKEDLFSKTSGPNHQFDADIIAVYREFRNDMSRDATYFVSKPKDKGLYGMSGEPYILEAKDTDLQKLYEEDAKDPNKRVYAGLDKESMTDEQKRQFEKEKENFSGFTVTDEFYKFLVSMDRWDFAHGRFDSEMARRIKNR